MKLSEDIALKQALLEREGDMDEFTGDMESVKEEDHKVVLAENGKKFLHIGEW